VYDIEKTYYFNKKTKIRVEEFGATISLGLNEFYVNKNVYDFILILKESEKIDKEALLNIIQINDFLINFLNQLLANCIIYEK
jgi:hypothetical protein